MTAVIEFIVCLTSLFLIYSCCLKPIRPRSGNEDQHDTHSTDSSGARVSSGQQDQFTNRDHQISVTPEISDEVLARKDLIRNNLFSKRITRQESVKELYNILAISRGGAATDEEMGGHSTTFKEKSPADSGRKLININQVEDTHNNCQDASSNTSASPLPTPSAPPIPVLATNVSENITEMNNVQLSVSSTTKIASLHAVPPGNFQNPVSLGSWRNLWDSSVLFLKKDGHETCALYKKDQYPIECSICLENFSPNNTIAWAKDGGDPTPNSLPSVSSPGDDNNYLGCDHIFHEECLMSWLQHHDECPLCRRRVVHADAHIRFAGWK